MSAPQMLWLLAISFFLLSPATSPGQNVLSLSPGASGGALGNIRTTHQNVLALYGNEAGLAHLSDPSFYASVERRFNSEGLNFYSLLGALPTRYGAFGINIFYHGFEEYNEKLLGLSYARRLVETLAIGARFDFIQASIPTYGNTTNLTAEFGLQANISSSVLLGFHIHNPFEIRWLKDELLPTIFSLGISYKPSDKVWISGEIEKVSDFRENIKWGLEYRVLDQLAFRIGINTNPALMSFGFGYSMDSGLSCDIGSTVHQELGLSPLGGIGFVKKNK